MIQKIIIQFIASQDYFNSIIPSSKHFQKSLLTNDIFIFFFYLFDIEKAYLAARAVPLNKAQFIL